MVFVLRNLAGSGCALKAMSVTSSCGCVVQYSWRLWQLVVSTYSIKIRLASILRRRQTFCTTRDTNRWRKAFGQCQLVVYIAKLRSAFQRLLGRFWFLQQVADYLWLGARNFFCIVILTLLTGATTGAICVAADHWQSSAVTLAGTFYEKVKNPHSLDFVNTAGFARQLNRWEETDDVQGCSGSKKCAFMSDLTFFNHLLKEALQWFVKTGGTIGVAVSFVVYRSTFTSFNDLRDKYTGCA